MFEGYPSGTPPQTIFKGLKYRHGLELEERRDQAQTLVSALIAFTQGGQYLDIAGHLYPPGFDEKLKESQRETEALNTSIKILDKFRAISAEWEE